MAGDSGTSFPVAGLAVVALFLSTAFLAPYVRSFFEDHLTCRRNVSGRASWCCAASASNSSSGIELHRK